MTRILVVEDEESFSEALGYLLGREGFDVTLADTGTKAIEEFTKAINVWGSIDCCPDVLVARISNQRWVLIR